MEEVRKEGVSILYKDDKISIVGNTFRLEGSLSTPELTKVYMGEKGRSVVTLSIKLKESELPKLEEKSAPQPEKRKLTINAYIDELVEKGLTEYEIMNNEIFVN